MAYFFASPIDIDVKLEGEELRKQVEIKSEKEKNISCPVYYDGDSLTGQVSVLLRTFLKLYLQHGFPILYRSLSVCETGRRQRMKVSRWNLWAVSVR